MAISKRLRFEVLRRDDHTCRYCGAKADGGAQLVVDHVIPEALGGRTEPENLVTACEPCNSGKSSMQPEAAQVAATAQDAAKWADAIRHAATQMLAERSSIEEANQRFLDRWNRWRRQNSDAPEPLPPDWGEAVARFRALGLPDELVDDAITTTMSRWGVADRFRYFCGVAWSLVRDLQDRAHAVAGDTTPAPAQPTRTEALAKILDRCDPPLPDWEYDRILLEFREATIYGPGEA